jgi:hypothetical protein
MFILFSQFGCGNSISTVLKKYKIPYQEKREQLKKISESLPPKGSIGNNLTCRELNPKIRFDEKAEDINTEMLMFEQLSDPDFEPEWNLLLSGDLLHSIRWTGPKNPLSESVLSDNGESIEKDLLAALEYRYLVVNRVNEITQPELKDENNYTRGNATIDTFIFDLKENKTICGFSTSAKSLEDLSTVPIDTKITTERKQISSGGKYSKPKYQEIEHKPLPKIVQLQKAVKTSFWENARTQILDKLRELTKANIKLEIN